MKTSPLAFLVLVIHLVVVSSFAGAQCEPTEDCNGNGILDSCDIAEYFSDDCDNNGTPDECQISLDQSLDCNQDLILDACEGALEDLLEGLDSEDYGKAMDMTSNWLAIGAPEHSSGGESVGAVYLYRNIGSRWVSGGMLQAPIQNASDEYGYSVAITDDVLVVGAPGSSNSGSSNEGSVYVYRRDGMNWNLEQQLEPDGSNHDAEFGVSVDVQGDVIAVGAWYAQTTSDSGSVYLYSFNGQIWELGQLIQSPDSDGEKQFASSVEIDGDFLAVSDPRADVGPNDDAGAVYIYKAFSSTLWAFSQKVTSIAATEGGKFGESIDMIGSQLLVGAPESGSGARGEVHLFTRSPNVFEVTTVVLGDSSNHKLGFDVALASDGFAASAWRAGSNRGQIHVYQQDSNDVYQQTIFIPATAVSGDLFGESVASGGRWVAGSSIVDDYVAIDRLIQLADCDNNGVDDPCDIYSGTSQDCNQDGTPDSCQIADGELSDCNGDGIPDSCQLADGSELDCNLNDVIDSCDIANGDSPDCNINGIPDDCEDDCNQNGIEDSCEIDAGTAFDCNGNSVLDQCDLSAGTDSDCNNNSIPDGCEIESGDEDDCNSNGLLDVCDIIHGFYSDCNSNTILDLCEIENGTAQDCNNNDYPDICDVAYGVSSDCDGDLVPDECELISGTEFDCNENGIIDSCDILAGISSDCEGNGIPDECDVAAGALDCDGNGVPDECQTDADTTLPTITGLSTGISLLAAQGECAETATWDEPTVTDDCGVESVTSSHDSGASFPVGDTVVTYTATDVSGNVATANFTITVTDDQLPTIIGGPADISLDNEPGSCSAAADWVEPTAADNCGIQSLTSDHSATSTFPVGVTTVTYTATDLNGNSTTHSFSVTVSDADLPTIQGLPGPVFVNSNPGLCTAQVSWPVPTFEDNCPGVQGEASHPSGMSFAVGTTLVTYTATDASGNTAVASFELTVIDNENPTIANAPASVVLNNDEDLCGAAYFWDQPALADNCGAPALTSNLQSGHIFEVGTTLVTLNVDDGNSNLVEVGFTVTVEDNTAPLVSRMPEDITINADQGACDTMVTWEEPEAADNCGMLNFVANHTPGLYSVGTTEVVYTAQDIHGNITVESFNVTVVDAELPEISGLPVDLTTDNLLGLCGANLAWPEPSASDNCGVESIVSSHASGIEFPVGTTTVVYTVTDVNGNVSEDSFLVTIHDVDQPEIDNLPDDILSTNDAGDCGAIITWTEPNAWDNCSVSDLSSTHPSGSFFPVGSTTVTYTATDDTGLQHSESFIVTVNDDESPELIGLIGQVTFTNSEGFCAGIATWDEPTAEDNCEVAGIESTHQPGWSFDVGNTLVTYTVTDIHGNTSEESLIVTILDNEAPVFVSVPDSIETTTEPGICTTIVDWEIPVVADNCEIFSLSTSNLRGTVFEVGVTTVTYTATDVHGNMTEHSFVISVTDSEMPVISPVPLVVEVNTELGLCEAAAHWEDAFATDNCGILSFNESHQSGEIFPLGSTTVTLSTTDIHFNETVVSFEVVVTDAELPVFTSMPSDIDLIAEAGLCSAMAEWESALGTDNCGVASIESDRQSGEHFDVGTTEVTFTITDDNGNSHQESILITVTDLELPVITNLPPRVTVGTEPGICLGTTSWTTPDTSDNCGVATLVASVESGSMLPIGETAVTYTVTDIHGNASSQSFIVTVEDQELPEILDVPTDMVLTNDAGVCGAVATWAAPNPQDNCAISNFTSSHNSGDLFPVGLTTVTLTATDSTGNMKTETFQITVNDEENPVLLGVSGDIQITAENGLCGASVSWTDPSATDNCDMVTVSSTHNPGDFFDVGSHTVVYTAEDLYGNEISEQFQVTVTDDENPVINGLSANIVQTADPGVCEALVTWSAASATDNCEVASLTSDHQSGDTFPVGTTLVTYTALDIHGNSSTGAFSVTVEDDENPQFIALPDRVTVANDTGECGANVSWSEPQAQDNCSVDNIVLSHQSGDQFIVGDTTVNLTVTDIHGNSTDASFIVTVEDLENPAITEMPQSIQLNNDFGQCGALVSWIEPTATDNCQVNTFEPSIDNGSFFEVGLHVVTYTAIDIHGNFSSEKFFVTVIDNEDPTIAGMPLDISITAEAGQCSSAVIWPAPVPQDNCEILESSSSHLPGDTFLVGTTVVTYATSDIHGNEYSAEFSVTVTDDENPLISDMPNNIQVNNDAGQCGAVSTWTEPSATDNCLVASFTSDHASGDFFPVGDTVVKYTAEDIHGNISTSEFMISITDNEVPSISGMSADVSVDNDAGQCGALITWADPSADDNCEVQSFTSTHASGDFFEVGSTTVTYTAIDIYGNEKQESFQVDVADAENPTISGLSGDLASTNDAGACGAVIAWTNPTAADNCEIQSFTSTHDSGDFFEVGTTTVTYTAVDIHNNELSGSFDVTITDDENPTISNVPASMVISNDLGECSAVASWTLPSANDNCEVQSITSSHESGTAFPVGLTVVELVATDIHGNTSNDSFLITVTDNENPVLSGVSGDLVVANQPGQCGASVSWVDPSENDNCGVVSSTQSHNSGHFFLVGSTTVTYQITDQAGNSASASFEVTVLDQENPTISGLSGDLSVETDSGQCSAIVSWTAPQVGDNCGIASFELSHDSGSVFSVGTTQVTATVTDEAGNQTTDSFTVTVTDKETPEILGMPASMTIENDPGVCGAVITWSEPSAQDNCGTVSLSSDYNPGDLFPVGSTIVTYTALDQYGNSSSDSFTVVVEDLENPNLLGTRVDLSVENDPGLCSAVVTWSAFGIVDNCAGSSLEISHPSGTSFAVGTTEVTITLTDAAGNQVIENFNVTVSDTENPLITDPADIVVDATPETCDATMTIPALVANDNCDLASVTNDYTGTANASGTYPLGDTLITWTVTDIHGNSSSAEQMVTVNVDLTDCNTNGVPDACEIASGAANDCNANGIPDDCEQDCNGNGTPDDCDINSGASQDSNSNGLPDECETQFMRGDVNVNGSVDVTDPIFVLQYVIGTGPTPTCLDSADINNDNQLDITDPISLLQYLFLASTPPAAPFNTCGIDPDGISIGCDSYSNCP